MTLVVEDGTGVTGADSYESLAAVDAFHAARGNTSWAALSVSARESAIRRATDYLDVWHVSGDALKVSQGLNWPFAERDYLDVDLKQLRKAVAMLSVAAISGDLVARSPDTAQVLSSTDRVGDLSESRTYADRSDSVTILNGIDVSFLNKILNGFSASGGMVIGRRSRG